MSEEAFIAYVVISIVMAIVCAVIAERKGFNPGGWLLLGLLVWPIALLAILIKPNNTQGGEQQALARGEMKKCPECAESVRAEATKCRFCGHLFTQEENTAREREELEALARPSLRRR
jgi:hypothetical protein